MMDWSLPGPQKFLGRCLEAREHWKAAVVVTPTFLIDDFGWTDLKQKLRLGGMGDLEVVRVGDGDYDPARNLAGSLGVDGVYSADDLADSENLPCSNIGIWGLHDAGEFTRGRWCGFLKDFSGAVHRRTQSSVWLVVLMPPTAQYPTPDTFLDVIPWWGQMTEADITIATRERMEKFPPTSSSMKLWVESLCLGFGTARLDFIDRIVEAAPIGTAGVRSMVTDLLDGRRVNGRSVYAKMPLELVALAPAHPEPKSEGARRWEQGLLDWSDVWGVEEFRFDENTGDISSEWLNSRLCRGQQVVVGRAIEKVRCAVDLWIEHKYGGRWDDGLSYGDLNYENERREGILGLYRLAEKFESGRSDFPKTILRLLRSWKNVRDDLAHNKPIDYETLDYIVAKYESFLKIYQS